MDLKGKNGFQRPKKNQNTKEMAFNTKEDLIEIAQKICENISEYGVSSNQIEFLTDEIYKQYIRKIHRETVRYICLLDKMYKEKNPIKKVNLLKTTVELGEKFSINIDRDINILGDFDAEKSSTFRMYSNEAPTVGEKIVMNDKLDE